MKFTKYIRQYLTLYRYFQQLYQEGARDNITYQTSCFSKLTNKVSTLKFVAEYEISPDLIPL